MKYWLHIIGEKYGEKKFIKEAKRIGIQRAIPALQLATKSWGDTVYTGIMSKINGHTRIKVFGYFNIRTISVVRTESTIPILGRLARERRESQITRVERICGSYSVVSVSITDRDLHDYYEAFKDVKGARILIGAPPNSFTQIERILLKDASFFRGFREVRNLVEIEEQIERQNLERLLYELDDYHLN